MLPPLALKLVEYAAPTKPGSRELLVIATPAPMVMESALLVAVRWVPLVESVTVILRLLVPVAVGVPEIMPAVLMVKPFGNPLADQV